MRVESLWMNRPWRHVDLLMDMFARYQNRDRLIARLKSAFPKVAELEALAIDKGVQIRDAFQGHTIGPFTILSPSAYRYLFLVAESEKTPCWRLGWMSCWLCPPTPSQAPNGARRT